MKIHIKNGRVVDPMSARDEVADSPRSTIVDQVTNGVSVRMALLYLMLGGPDGGHDTEEAS